MAGKDTQEQTGLSAFRLHNLMESLWKRQLNGIFMEENYALSAWTLTSLASRKSCSAIKNDLYELCSPDDSGQALLLLRGDVKPA